jgi:hypothetical protein
LMFTGPGAAQGGHPILHPGGDGAGAAVSLLPCLTLCARGRRRASSRPKGGHL